MERDSILQEIARLEREKMTAAPHMEVAINAQITTLCNKLKRLGRWKPRKVV